MTDPDKELAYLIEPKNAMSMEKGDISVIVDNSVIVNNPNFYANWLYAKDEHPTAEADESGELELLVESSSFIKGKAFSLWATHYPDRKNRVISKGRTVYRSSNYGVQQETFPFAETSERETQREVERLREERLKLKEARFRLQERERQKSEEIYSVRVLRDEMKQARRELEEAKRQIERLNNQIEGQQRCLLVLSEACKASLDEKDAKVCMYEEKPGDVVRIVDDEVSVEFETPDGVFERVFHRDQFVNRQLPEQYERLVFRMFAWRLPATEVDIDSLLTEAEKKHGFLGFKQRTKVEK